MVLFLCDLFQNFCFLLFLVFFSYKSRVSQRFFFLFYLLVFHAVTGIFRYPKEFETDVNWLKSRKLNSHTLCLWLSSVLISVLFSFALLKHLQRDLKLYLKLYLCMCVWTQCDIFCLPLACILVIITFLCMLLLECGCESEQNFSCFFSLL